MLSLAFAAATLVLAAPPADPVLAGLDGREHRPLVPSGSRATVVVFALTDCPIANRFAPEIRRLEQAYASKGVRFYLAYVDANLDPAKAKRHAAAYGFGFPVLLDATRELTKRLGATHTPQAFLLDREGKVVYRGRIDDRYPRIGVYREPTRRDLRIALDELLTGRPVTVPKTETVGCLIG
jgi:thiol-disulfide isomerase/thioredoxin